MCADECNLAFADIKPCLFGYLIFSIIAFAVSMIDGSAPKQSIVHMSIKRVYQLPVSWCDGCYRVFFYPFPYGKILMSVQRRL